MSDTVYYPDEVRDKLTDWLNGTTPGPRYIRDGVDGMPDDKWREAEVPIALQRSSEAASHLSFSVDERSAFDLGGIVPGTDSIYIRLPIIVDFLWEIRPGNQKEDWKLASAACIHVFRLFYKTFEPANPEIEIIVPDGAQLWRRDPTTDDRYLRCQVFFQAQFYAPLMEA